MSPPGFEVIQRDHDDPGWEAENSFYFQTYRGILPSLAACFAGMEWLFKNLLMFDHCWIVLKLLTQMAIWLGIKVTKHRLFRIQLISILVINQSSTWNIFLTPRYSPKCSIDHPGDYFQHMGNRQTRHDDVGIQLYTNCCGIHAAAWIQRREYTFWWIVGGC